MFRKVLSLAVVIMLAVSVFPFNAVAEQTVTPVVSAGDSHTVIIKADGSLWAWGWNERGQLGNGGVGDRWFRGGYVQSTPVQIGTDTDWIYVSAGFLHTVAIKADGSLWAWGNNSHGQLGNNRIDDVIRGEGIEIQTTPVQIGTDTDWVSVSAGYTHTVAIRADGSLWAWGRKWLGERAGGELIHGDIPVQIGAATDWVYIFAGSSFTRAIKVDGTLWAWGTNHWGQLGDGTTYGRRYPVQIGTDTDWVSSALRADGTLWALGSISDPLIGDGATEIRQHVQLGTATDWVSVSRNGLSSGVRADGSLWHWGWFLVGGGGYTVISTPRRVGLPNGWVSTSAGALHIVASRADGSIWAWGSNRHGQLGGGTTDGSLTPVQIFGPQFVTVTLNGSLLSFDVPPIMQDGRTLVPLRAIFEAMGAEVEWNGNTQTLTATRADTVVIMQVGNSVISVGGERIILDVAPQIVNDRTLVPARAVAEAFGASVDWNGNMLTVIITDNFFEEKARMQAEEERERQQAEEQARIEADMRAQWGAFPNFGEFSGAILSQEWLGLGSASFQYYYDSFDNRYIERFANLLIENGFTHLAHIQGRTQYPDGSGSETLFAFSLTYDSEHINLFINRFTDVDSNVFLRINITGGMTQ